MTIDQILQRILLLNIKTLISFITIYKAQNLLSCIRQIETTPSFFPMENDKRPTKTQQKARELCKSNIKKSVLHTLTTSNTPKCLDQNPTKAIKHKALVASQ